MPYSRVTRTAYGADAIRYARGNGKGHDGSAVRNQYVAGVNMMPDDVIPFEEQMQYYWDHASAQHKIQVNRFIISFGPDELNPDDPNDCLTALEIGCQFARENASDCQSAVFVQTDGVGHKVHAHIITNDVKITDFKGLEHAARHHSEFSRTVDRICARYIDSKPLERSPERVTQAVRGQRRANEHIRAMNEEEQQIAALEGREPELIAEKYIWIDDLRERIKKAAAGAADEDEFAQRLRLDGVELVPQPDKATGKLSYRHRATRTQPEHYLFELVDTFKFPDKVPQNLKSKSHKLGNNYQPDSLAKMFRQPDQPAPDKPKPQMSERDRINAQIKTFFGRVMRAYSMDPENEDELFGDFIQWRVKKRDEEAKAGRKLPPVTAKNNEGKTVIMRTELARECREFLSGVMDAQAKAYVEWQAKQLAQNGFQDIADKDKLQKDDRGLGDD